MRPTNSALLSVLLLLVSALSPNAFATPAQAAGALSIQIERSARFTPKDIRYQWHGRRLDVHGRIDKIQDYHGRILGHVNIDLLDDEGRVLRRHSGALATFSPSRRNPRSAYFHTRVENVPAGVVQLRVKHATGAWH